MITKYDDVFTNFDNIIDILKEQWISISLKSNAIIKPSKVYSLSYKNRKVINVIFNEL